MSRPLTKPFVAVFCLAAASMVLLHAAGSLVKDGQELYRQGKLGDALIKFEEAAKTGLPADGELYYQVGFCLKMVREDLGSSREYMTKAVPLLEAAPPSTPAPLYYLAAIQSIELGESDKGKATALKGVEQAEKGAWKKATSGEDTFQIARLYSLAGEAGKAIPWYEKAVAQLEKDKDANRQYLTYSVDLLARHYHAQDNFPKASLYYQKLMAIDPGSEQTRMSAGFVMIRAGDYQQALQTLVGFKDDALMTEANYITRALEKYIQIGQPPIPPDKAVLDDAALIEAMSASARKLGEIRTKEEADAKAKGPSQDEPQYETITTKSGKTVKVFRPKYKPVPEDFQPKDPAHPTPEEAAIMSGVVFDAPSATPPASPERLAAEKEFFPLLIEYLRRGKYVREMAFQRGFASLLFR